MPLVSSFDGVNRQVILDPSVANSTWAPLDVFREYLAHRRDTEQFRGFEPLIRMQGGQPTATGQQPRFLQTLTDSRGILTKFILPDVGPYRTLVDGVIETDQPGTDPEPFNVSGLTTTGIIIDYKPREAEVITVGTGGALTPAQDALLSQIQLLAGELWQLQGLDPSNPVTVTPAGRNAGAISQTITGDGETTSTVTRQ